ncbi:PaaX family transcriptional regulator C-terminal domain-containing protein [Nesterenkonia muleiensis]|uniref:PaaX family transcriptional regulator n=1 Tax=Nesterenkonia muleiensis TaxID=2282648 RepID=UPI00138FC9FA|nr:PaaX family transcriptional regulator C-terminal domain-containing protein [Nesterenkonia muleiensis]
MSIHISVRWAGECKLLRDPTDSYGQRLIITTLGDYGSLVHNPIPSSSLVRVMEEFDLSSGSCRSALSRLVRAGYLDRVTRGRTTAYQLSLHGESLVREGRERIVKFGTPKVWDGRWSLVVFSVAENKRHVRHVVRTRLRELGFAPFFDGTWIAANSDIEEVTRNLNEIEHAEIAIFDGELKNSYISILEKARKNWKLDNVSDRYIEFIDAFTPIFEKLKSNKILPEEAFVTRTRLMDEWRVFPRIDPELPDEIVPVDWPRPRARRLFDQLYEMLRPSAEVGFTQILDRES